MISREKLALAALKEIQRVVFEQAENEGLWSVPAEGLQGIGEAYLQRELRRLHDVIERFTIPLFEKVMRAEGEVTGYSPRLEPDGKELA